MAKRRASFTKEKRSTVDRNHRPTPKTPLSGIENRGSTSIEGGSGLPHFLRLEPPEPNPPRKKKKKVAAVDPDGKMRQVSSESGTTFGEVKQSLGKKRFAYRTIDSRRGKKEEEGFSGDQGWLRGVVAAWPCPQQEKKRGGEALPLRKRLSPEKKVGDHRG